MRIDGPNRPVPLVPGSPRRTAAGGSSFALGEETPPARTGQLSQSQALSALGSVLALQEVEDPLVRRRRAVRRGHALLDELEDLRLALIDGAIGAERLDRIALHLAQRESTGDARLEALIDDIELRVQVELAKLGRFGG
jgi:hypothetical protein